MNTDKRTAILQTPRRSTRKSTRPPQDYEEIVEKKSLRSMSKKTLNEDIGEEEEDPHPKWTLAEVGKSSQKRGKRKTVGAKKRRKIELGDNECVDDKENEGLMPIEPEPSAAVSEEAESKQILLPYTEMPSDAEKISIGVVSIPLLDSNKNAQKDDDENVQNGAAKQQMPSTVLAVKNEERKIAGDLISIGVKKEEEKQKDSISQGTIDIVKPEDDIPSPGLTVGQNEEPKITGDLIPIGAKKEEEKQKVYSISLHAANFVEPKNDLPLPGLVGQNEESKIGGDLIPIGVEKEEEKRKGDSISQGAGNIVKPEGDIPSPGLTVGQNKDPEIPGDLIPIGVKKENSVKEQQKDFSVIAQGADNFEELEDDMPSLLLSDSEGEDETNVSNTEKALNETFDSSEQVKTIAPEVPLIVVHKPEDKVKSPLFRDGEEPEVVAKSLNETFNASDCVDVISAETPEIIVHTLEPGRMHSPMLHDEEVKQIATLGNDTFNASDCVEIISVEYPQMIANDVDSEERKQALMLSDVEEEKITIGGNSLNDTFNASDCVEVTSTEVPEITVHPEQPEEGNMALPMLCSGTEQIIPTVGNSLNETFNASDCVEIISPATEISNTNNSIARSAFKKTHKPDLKVSMAASPPMTPQGRRKISRVATPYRVKNCGTNEKYKTNKQISDGEHKPGDVAVLNTTMDITDIVHSVRKRSNSLCNPGEKIIALRSPRKVKFHSPSNTTAVIEDFDLSIAQSVIKAANEKTMTDKMNDTNVTKRRKRSISLGDATYNARYPSGSQTPQKTGLMRTKLPNFAAIHKKQFNQMENLVDHVTRKTERAKLLANSAGKIQSASAAKLSKPNTAGSKLNANSRLPMARRALKPALDITQFSAPDLRFDGKSKPQTHTHAKPALQKNCTPKKALNASEYLNTLRECKAPKPFNLSTAIPTQQVSSIFVPSASDVVPQPSRVPEDKLATRRQRHVQMFKSRGDNNTRTAQTEAIRGVRSNRRFELQMQYRRNMEKN